MMGEEERTNAEALRALEDLEARAARRLPGWSSRGPEDPARVLLEIFACAIAELGAEVTALERRLLPRLFLELGEEGLWPEPARGFICLVPRRGLEEAVRVPAGTRVTSARRSSLESPPPERPAFETAGDAWLSPARLAAAFAVEGERRAVLPVFDPREARPAAGLSGAGVALFHGAAPERHLYLGDPAWNLVRGRRVDAVVEWPGAPAFAAEGAWEYSTRGGFRVLPVSFLEDEGIDGGRALRMKVPGPLPDLAEHTIEGARLPWLRLALPGRGLSFAPPRLVWLPPPPAAHASPELLPRLPARVLLRSERGWDDYSFAAGAVALEPPDADLGPAIYLGWDRPLPAGLFWKASAPPSPDGWEPPRLLWEHSSARGFLPLDVADGSRSFSRSGLVSWGMASDWSALERFGRRLHWLRARWVDGEYYHPPSVQMLFPGAAEVIEGVTWRDRPIELALDETARKALLPRFPEGDHERFRWIEIPARAAPRSERKWRRLAEAPQGRAPGEGEFRLRRLPGIGVEIELGAAELEGRGARIPAVRSGFGAGRAFAAGSLSVLEADVPGLERIEQPLEIAAGREAEGFEAFQLRLRAEWKAGGRAVTAGDFRSLVEAVDPGIARVEVVPAPEKPWEIVLVVFPHPPCRPGAIAPARLAWLEGYLSAKTPLGTVVRVVEPCYLPCKIEVGAAALGAEEETGLLSALEAQLRSLLDPVAGGLDGNGYPLGRALRQSDLEPIMSRLFDPRGEGMDSQPFYRIEFAAETEEEGAWRLGYPVVERCVPARGGPRGGGA
jgi:hypothetical protein